MTVGMPDVRDSHKHAKISILNTLLYSKLHKNNKSVDLSVHIFKSLNLTDLLFLGIPSYKIFDIYILQVCGIHHWLQPDLFSDFFLKLINMFFDYFKWREHWNSGARDTFRFLSSYKDLVLIILPNKNYQVPVRYVSWGWFNGNLLIPRILRFRHHPECRGNSQCSASLIVCWPHACRRVRGDLH